MWTYDGIIWLTKIRFLMQHLINFQTLIAAAIAFAGAWLTVRAIRQQIDVQKEHIDLVEKRESETQARRTMRARIELPDALFKLHSYAVLLMRSVLKGASFHDPPEASLMALKKAIEFVDKPASERMYEMLTWYQIVVARLSERKSNIEKADRFSELIAMQAYVVSLYPYARREIERGPDGPITLEILQSTYQSTKLDLERLGMYEDIKNIEKEITQSIIGVADQITKRSDQRRRPNQP